MPLKLDGFSQQFAAAHPEIGEIEAGAAVTGEQAIGLGDIFSRKILELSRKPGPELTTVDIRFIDHVSDLAARNLIYGLDRRGMRLPDSPATQDLQARAQTLITNAGLQGEPSTYAAPKPHERPPLASVLEPLAGGGLISLRDKPDLRPNVEDFAVSAVVAFGDMVQASGGELRLDTYLAGNLRNMLAHYEIVEAQPSAQAQV